jgi:hypothetical protein
MLVWTFTLCELSQFFEPGSRTWKASVGAVDCKVKFSWSQVCSTLDCAQVGCSLAQNVMFPTPVFPSSLCSTTRRMIVAIRGYPSTVSGHFASPYAAVPRSAVLQMSSSRCTMARSQGLPTQLCVITSSGMQCAVSEVSSARSFTIKCFTSGNSTSSPS